ncbi:Uncharacterised protein [Mycobacteroides abscessus subsp. abscessus]|nr:Uncharacterised protein [Mycobacteroides abscessus subsp. abscessus]
MSSPHQTPPWRHMPPWMRVGTVVLNLIGFAAAVLAMYLVLGMVVLNPQAFDSAPEVLGWTSAILLLISAVGWLRHKAVPGYVPRMTSLFLVVPLWIAGAGLFALAINAYLRASPDIIGNASQIEVFRTTLAVVGAAGLVFGGVYAFRKQRLEESSQRRSDSESFAVQLREIAQQLGSDISSVRLAGVVALGQLSDDWPSRRTPCVEILTGSIRAWSVSGRVDRGVERVAFETIRRRLVDPRAPSNWCGLLFDLSECRLSSFDISGATLTKGTEFKLDDTVFTGSINLSNLNLNGGHISAHGTTFNERVVLARSRLENGTITIHQSRFNDGLEFREIVLYGANIVVEHSVLDDLVVQSSELVSGHLCLRWNTFTRATLMSNLINGASLEMSGEFIDGHALLERLRAGGEVRYENNDRPYLHGYDASGDWRFSILIGLNTVENVLQSGTLRIGLDRGTAVDLRGISLQGGDLRVQEYGWRSAPRVSWSAESPPAHVSPSAWELFVGKVGEQHEDVVWTRRQEGEDRDPSLPCVARLRRAARRSRRRRVGRPSAAGRPGLDE